MQHTNKKPALGAIILGLCAELRLWAEGFLISSAMSLGSLLEHNGRSMIASAVMLLAMIAVLLRISISSMDAVLNLPKDQDENNGANET